MIKIYIATIFPNIFPSVLSVSLLKKALEKKIWSLEIINLLNFSENKRIDDKIFGGLPGMLIKPTVIENLINSFEEFDKIFYTNPTGEILNQNYLLQQKIEILNSLSIKKTYRILILCGRYEGIDARVIKFYKIKEFSLGPFILCGGEIAAMALVESLIRLIPGVIKNKHSLENESFSENNLQYEKYTRPAIWKNINVPKTLLSGNHKEILKWKKDNTFNLKK